MSHNSNKLYISTKCSFSLEDISVAAQWLQVIHDEESKSCDSSALCMKQFTSTQLNAQWIFFLFSSFSRSNLLTFAQSLLMCILFQNGAEVLKQNMIKLFFLLTSQKTEYLIQGNV